MPPPLALEHDHSFDTDHESMRVTYSTPVFDTNGQYDSSTDYGGCAASSDADVREPSILSHIRPSNQFSPINSRPKGKSGEKWTSEPVDTPPSTISDTDSGLEDARSEDSTDEFKQLFSNVAKSSSPRTKIRSEQIPMPERNRKPAPQMVDTATEEIINLSIRSSRARTCSLDIHAFHPIYPKSQYQGWTPPSRVSKEWQVVEEFTQHFCHGKPHEESTPSRTQSKTSLSNAIFDDEEFTEFQLEDFSVYLPGSNALHAYELVSLNNLATKVANSTYRFDGILSNGNVQRYVENVPFKLCSIGGYGEDIHEVGDHIWVQSTNNERKNIWYRLGHPAAEYARYHINFIWLANLSKYFIDFAHHEADEGRLVSIFSFREEFFAYQDAIHNGNASFASWVGQYNDTDFRRAVAANSEFLYKEAIGVDSALEKHTIWSEILLDLSIILEQPLDEINTIVTPFVYECFKNRVFTKWLKAVEPVKDVALRRQSLGDALKLTDGPGEKGFSGESASVKLARKLSETQRKSSSTGAANPNVSKPIADVDLDLNLDIASIVQGDVLGIATDAKHLSRWEVQDDLWFVYVLKVNIDKRGTRSFNVMWLYKPSDTICDKMDYTYDNELFMSDHCNCGDPPIFEDDVLCKVTVDFDVSPSKSKSNFFIRQTYLSNEYSFITYKKEHMLCPHQQDLLNVSSHNTYDEYQVGDTVLVLKHLAEDTEDGHLEPHEIVEFVHSEGRNSKVRLRKLAFRNKHFVEDGIAPNELVYTDRIHCTSIKNIIRKCLVRFYTQEEVRNGLMQTPYDRKGTGDAFYITTRLVEDREQRLEHIGVDIPRSLKQGFDPRERAPRKVLRGMDLYCGGGNFGRGLEEGGAVHMKWAVDIDSNALHTYHANMKHPDDTKLFLGSVDDFLAQAMAGNSNGSYKFPLPGDVDFICAGSPCQGYSLMNSYRGNDKGLKNQSLVASVAAYIDFYRPKYALLENVTTMAACGKWRHENALSQLLCAFVGMNYQVQLFTLDAWSFGSPQARTRLFVSLAAPGLQLPPHPALSHSHPPDTRDRGLGKAANGQRFGLRRKGAATYPYVTAGDAVADLPWIGDSRPMSCIPFPDHRICIGISEELKAMIELIPTYPRGMNFSKTWAAGRRDGRIVAREKVLMSDAERAVFPSDTDKKGQVREAARAGSRAFGRVHPDGLFHTVTTMYSIQCSRNGTVLHWDQQRPLSVMEVRRAQSYPDHEVLTGTPRKQWKIIGNSVSRAVSLALGLSLREAWLKNPPDEEMPCIAAGSTPKELFKNVFVEKEIIEISSDSDSDPDVSFPALPPFFHRPLLHAPSRLPESASSSNSLPSLSRAFTGASPPQFSSSHSRTSRPSKRPLPPHDSTSSTSPPKRRSLLTDPVMPKLKNGMGGMDGDVRNMEQNGVVPKEGDKEKSTNQNEVKGVSQDNLGTVADVMQSDESTRVLVGEKRFIGVYVPVDNSAFEAYAITAREMGR